MLEYHHIKALGAIVGYDAERGDIKSTLLDATALLNHYSNKYNAQQPHPIVVNSIVKLIASHGAHKVLFLSILSILSISLYFSLFLSISLYFSLFLSISLFSLLSSLSSLSSPLPPLLFY
jgi:hypothetical protein